MIKYFFDGFVQALWRISGFDPLIDNQRAHTEIGIGAILLTLNQCVKKRPNLLEYKVHNTIFITTNSILPTISLPPTIIIRLRLFIKRPHNIIHQLLQHNYRFLLILRVPHRFTEHWLLFVLLF